MTEDPNIATLREAIRMLPREEVPYVIRELQDRANEALSALAYTLAERDEALDGLRRTRLRSEALRALETLEKTSQLFDEDSYYALRERITKGEF